MKGLLILAYFKAYTHTNVVIVKKTDFHVLDLAQTIDLVYFISLGWFNGEKIFFCIFGK